MLIFRPLLSRLLPVVAVMVMLPMVGWAQLPKVQAVDYQAGLLNVTASGEFSSPQIEVWEGNAGPDATEMIFLSFENTQADISALQRMGEQLLLQNPDLKRFLVSPLDSDKKGGGGFQIALEVSIPPGAALFNPTISAGSDNQWLIALKQNAGSITPQLNQQTSSAAGQEGNHPSQNAGSKSTQAVKGTTKAIVTSPPCHVDSSTASQQIQALEAQVAQLQTALQTSQSKEEALQLELVRYNDMIREYQPDAESGNTREKQEMATIQNLRLAVLKLAQKLKTTEKELEIQTEKAQTLSRELSFQRQEAKTTLSTSSSPTLLMQVADEKPTAVAVKPASAFTKSTNKTTVYSAEMTGQATTKLTLAAAPKPSVSKQSASPIRPGTAATVTSPSPVTGQPGTAKVKSPAKIMPSVPTHSIVTAKMAAESKAKERRLQRSIQAQPKQTQAYLALSDLYIARGNWSGAEQMLSRLLKNNPTHKQGYYLLAWVYVYEKRKLEAQVALNTYRRLHPSDKTGIQSLQQALNSGSSPTPKQ